MDLFLEAYSREAALRNAGKRFEANAQAVGKTPEELFIEFENIDPTSEKKLVPTFAHWFKIFNFDETEYEEFIDTLKELAPLMAEALKRNIPILSQDYGIVNLLYIKTLEDLKIYAIEIKEDLEKKQEKREKREDIESEIKKSIAHKTDKYTVHKSETEKLNCILGKGTRWCISGTKTYNSTGLYKNLGTHEFILITTDVKKTVKRRNEEGELVEEVVPWKYAYHGVHPYTAMVLNANLCFDYRDDADRIPDFDDPYAVEIFQEMNKKFGIPILTKSFGDFVNQVKTGNFHVIEFPYELHLQRPEIPPGVLEITDDRFYFVYYGFLFYALGGGSKNKVWKNMLNRVAIPPNKAEEAARYFAWDNKYFFPEVFLPTFEIFKSAMKAQMSNNTFTVETDSPHRGHEAMFIYYIISNFIKNYGADNDGNNALGWAIKNAIKKIRSVKVNDAGFLECFDKRGNKVLSTADII